MDILSLQTALGTPLTGPQGAFQKMQSQVRGSSQKALSGVSQGAGGGGLAESAVVASAQARSPWPAHPAGHILRVQKLLQEGGRSWVSSWDPGCNENWMNRAHFGLSRDSASGLSQGLGEGQKGEGAALLCLSRADSEPVPL